MVCGIGLFRAYVSPQDSSSKVEPENFFEKCHLTHLFLPIKTRHSFPTNFILINRVVLRNFLFLSKQSQKKIFKTASNTFIFTNKNKAIFPTLFILHQSPYLRKINFSFKVESENFFKKDDLNHLYISYL